MEQRTDDWFNARLGCVTASRVSVVLSKGIGRQKYIEQLVAERISGHRQEQHFTNSAIQHGIDTEPLAVKAYEQYKNITVEEVAFVPHPSINFAGASPDGLVGKDGLIEIKCPNTKNHYRTIERHHIKPEYIKQMQWQLACTGRKWCDFVSYDPRAVQGRRFHIQRVLRDEALISKLEEASKLLLAEVEEFISKKASKKSALKTAKFSSSNPIRSKDPKPKATGKPNPKENKDIHFIESIGLDDQISEELLREYDELKAAGEYYAPILSEIDRKKSASDADYNSRSNEYSEASRKRKDLATKIRSHHEKYLAKNGEKIDRLLDEAERVLSKPSGIAPELLEELEVKRQKDAAELGSTPLNALTYEIIVRTCSRISHEDFAAFFGEGKPVPLEVYTTPDIDKIYIAFSKDLQKFALAYPSGLEHAEIFAFLIDKRGFLLDKPFKSNSDIDFVNDLSMWIE